MLGQHTCLLPYPLTLPSQRSRALCSFCSTRRTAGSVNGTSESGRRGPGQQKQSLIPWENARRVQLCTKQRAEEPRNFLGIVAHIRRAESKQHIHKTPARAFPFEDFPQDASPEHACPGRGSLVRRMAMARLFPHTLFPLDHPSDRSIQVVFASIKRSQSFTAG